MALSELFAKLAEEDRQLRLERERKGKDKGKHMEELKSKVKDARTAVLSLRIESMKVELV